MGAGATLSAGSGVIGNLHTGGNATLSNAGALQVINLNDHGVSGTLAKQGGGALLVSAGTLTATTLKTQGGLLWVPVASVSPSKTLALDGGSLAIRGAASPGGTANQLKENWYAYTENTIEPIGNLLSQTPGLVTTLTGPLAYHGADFAARTTPYLDYYVVANGGTIPANFSASWTGSITIPATGTYTLGTSSGDGSVWWIDKDGDGSFSHNGAAGDELIVNNNRYQGNTPQISTVTLVAGTYKMAIAFYQGWGGADMTAAFAPGATALNFTVGAADIVNPTGPMQLGLFSDAAPTLGPVNLPTTPALVTNSSILTIESGAVGHLGALTLQNGILTTQAAAGVTFASTTVSPTVAGAVVGLYANTPTTTGNITGPGAGATPFTFAAGGSQTFVLDSTARTVTEMQRATWRVDGITLHLKDVAALGGSSSVQLNGGRFLVDAAPTVAATNQAGLLFGEISGIPDVSGHDFSTPNPATSGTINLQQTEDTSIGEHTTYVFTGQIFLATGHASFRKAFDDNGWLKIDGNVVLNHNVWNQAATTGDLNLTPGWHDFELRLGNDGGPGGPNSGLGFGFSWDPTGGTDFVHLQDRGDGSILRGNAFAGTVRGAINLGGIALSVSADSTLEGVTDQSMTLGTLTLKNGVLTTAGVPFGITFANTAVDGATSGSVGLNLQTPTDLGVIDGNHQTVRIRKIGQAKLVLDKLNVNLENATIAAEGGRLYVSADSAALNTPLESATAAVKGGELVLTSKNGDGVVFDNNFLADGNGTMTAGKGSVGGAGTPTIFLGSPTKALTVAGGVDLTVQATDGYKLDSGLDYAVTGNAADYGNYLVVEGLSGATLAQPIRGGNPAVLLAACEQGDDQSSRSPRR
jgi:hypothetical protein